MGGLTYNCPFLSTGKGQFFFSGEKGGKKRKNLKNPLDKRENGWYTTKAARKKGRNSDKGPGSAGRNLKKFWKVLDKRAALGYNR